MPKLIRILNKRKNKCRVGLYKCDCGNEFEARLYQVKNGHTKSCGCLIKSKRMPSYDILYQQYLVDKLSTLKLSEIYNVNKTTILYWLKKYKIKSNAVSDYEEDLSGKFFGLLTVIKPSNKKNNRQRLWECKCKCNKVTIVSTGHLNNGSTKSCGSCGKRRESEHTKWNGYEEIHGTFFNAIKQNAKARNLNFDISIEDIYNLYLKQDKKCFWTNLDIHFKKGYQDYTASVDRINNDLGYTKENIVLVHKDINKIRNKLNIEDFLYLCNLIANPLPVQINKEIIIYQKPLTYKGFANISGAYWYGIVNRAKSRNYIIDVTIEQAWNQYLKQNGQCALTGIDLKFKSKHNAKDGNISLDRINSNKGYSSDNIQWVLHTVNIMKWDYDQNYFIRMCKLVSENRILKDNEK